VALSIELRGVHAPPGRHQLEARFPDHATTPEAPNSVGEDPSIAALLDAAEDIVNEAGPRIRSEVDADREKAARPKRWKFWKR